MDISPLLIRISEKTLEMVDKDIAESFIELGHGGFRLEVPLLMQIVRLLRQFDIQVNSTNNCYDGSGNRKVEGTNI